MERSAIVTGGTGGLGSAVVGRLLDDGWRVVVPWIVEGELERVPARDGLELVQADLFDPGAVANVVAQAAGAGEAPLRGVVNLVGGFAMGRRVHETPIDDFEEQFRLNLRPTYLVTAAQCRICSRLAVARSSASARGRRCSRSRAPPATSPRRPR